MAHKSGFLSGPEPTEEEEKTEAQLIDERRPASMRASSTMFELAEDDETPAIEQQAAKQDIISDSGASRKPILEASSDFEAEMKERQRLENIEREKRRKAEEEAEKKAAAEREAEIQKKLEETSHSLDPEEIKEKLKQENFDKNQEKLYPDAKPVADGVEDKIWHERTDKGDQIAGRAKLGDVYDTNLQNAIITAAILEVIGTLFAVIGYLFNNTLSVIFYLIAVATIGFAAFWLFKNANKSKQKNVPSEQKKQFTYTTLIPGMTVRILFVALISQVPMTGTLVGVVAGTAIGASIHYSFLNRYNIWVSLKDTVINTLVFLVAFAAIEFSSGDKMAIVMVVVALVEFFLGDRFAMLMAYRTNK